VNGRLSSATQLACSYRCCLIYDHDLEAGPEHVVQTRDSDRDHIDEALPASEVRSRNKYG
jgi:hypothetical protein